MFESNQFEETTTGLVGFTVPSDQIAPIPDFISGDNVPLGGLALTDLFPADAPSTLNDLWADSSIGAIGDFQNGFTEFSTHQRKVTDISQTDGPFIDGVALANNYTPFNINDNDNETIVNLDIHLDSAFNFSDGGFLSEGMTVQIVNVTDPDNVSLMTEVSGFYFADGTGVSSNFTMGENDLSSNFSNSPTGTGPDDPQEAVFAYEMNLALDPKNTYGVVVFGDASAGTSGLGTSYIDSSNTLDVALRIVDPGATFAIPGMMVVPEPTTAALMFVALISGVTARRQ